MQVWRSKRKHIDCSWMSLMSQRSLFTAKLHWTCMLITIHVYHNKHCIRDADALFYRITFITLLISNQTFHFTLSYIKRTGNVVVIYIYEWMDHHTSGWAKVAYWQFHANELLRMQKINIYYKLMYFT